MATTPQDPMWADAPERRDNRPLIFVLIAVLLLAALAWFFLLRDGGDDGDTGTDVEVSAPDDGDDELDEDDETDASEDGDGDGAGRVETFEVFAPKDPFDPLVSATTGGGGTTTDDGTTDDGTTDNGTADDGTTDDGTTDDGTVDGGTDDGTVDGGTDGGTTGGDGSGGDGSTTIDGRRVRVVDVFVQGGRNRAQVEVDGTVYTVDEGERFADNFQLQSAQGQCATMLYGDDQFTLCEGEEILK